MKQYLFLIVCLLCLPACGKTTPPVEQPPSDSPPPCVEIGQQWVSPVDGAALVCVPAGEFLMGAAESDSAAKRNEKPQHAVYLDAFWIDRTEVTNQNFARCMAEGACQPEVYDTAESDSYPVYATDPAYQDYPALVYQAKDAAAYCQWAGRRLPTEAEWEKAARGPDGSLYPWGDRLDCDRANYFTCHEDEPPPEEGTAPRCGYRGQCLTSGVETYPGGASPYGALNMAGNVWEWVADWYAPDYYDQSPAANPTGPQTGDFRVRRGGGCTSIGPDLRSSVRASGSPHHYFDGQMGFRCATGSP